MTDTTNTESSVVPEAPPKKRKGNPNLPKGAGNGQGRPLGSKNKYSMQASTARLTQLRFDPMEKLIEQFEKIEKRIADMDSGKTRYSAMAMQGFLTTQANIVNNLMKYGYRPVPERTEIDDVSKGPLIIKLTDS